MHDGMHDKPLSPGAGGEGAEQPLWQEFLELMHGIWVVFVNTAIFLAFANMLHRCVFVCLGWLSASRCFCNQHVRGVRLSACL